MKKIKVAEIFKVVVILMLIRSLRSSSSGTTSVTATSSSSFTNQPQSSTISVKPVSRSQSSEITSPNKATLLTISPTTTPATTLASKIKATSTVTKGVSTSSIPPTGSTRKVDDDSEPSVSLYVWEIVACGAGAFTFVLFVIIGILCYLNRRLKKRIRSLRNYSLPIKENGAWIDNQDIPLWQKRASTYNVQQNAGAETCNGHENPAAQDTEAT